MINALRAIYLFCSSTLPDYSVSHMNGALVCIVITQRYITFKWRHMNVQYNELCLYCLANNTSSLASLFIQLRQWKQAHKPRWTSKQFLTKPMLCYGSLAWIKNCDFKRNLIYGQHITFWYETVLMATRNIFVWILYEHFSLEEKT